MEARMPLMQRLEAPGALVHVMARGIDGRPIFIDDLDRHELLRRFAKHRAEAGCKCLAWCLMPNHYHFLLRNSEVPLGSLMRPLNGAYARWHNKKYGRRGYLFQDRFKSVICQDGDYAKELIRYIHLNPIRAGLASSLAKLRKWPWCGHGHMLGVSGALGSDFQDPKEALRRFGRHPQEAVQGYLAFLNNGIDAERPEISGGLQETEAFEIAGAFRGWPAVVGDAEFAREAMKRHEVARRRTHRQADYQEVLEAVAAKACSKFAVQTEDLMQRGRSNRRTAARAEFCRMAHFDERLPYAAIARFLGTTIPPVVILSKRTSSGGNGRALKY
jgi:putative transposase